MIRLRLNSAAPGADAVRVSPLAETVKSLYMTNSGTIHPLHRGWYERVRSDLGRVDRELLRAVVPPGGHIAEFLFVGATATTTTIEQQLQLVAGWPLEHFVSELAEARRGVGLSAAARRLVDLGADGPARVADALEQYWRVAVAPYWPPPRAVLDADVAYRVGTLARGGIAELMQDLHPSIELTEHAIRVASLAEGDVDGGGLTLVPCVFIWPHLWVELGLAGEPSLTYGARGIGALLAGRRWRHRGGGRARRAARPDPRRDPRQPPAAAVDDRPGPLARSDPRRPSARTWRSCVAAAWSPAGAAGGGCSTSATGWRPRSSRRAVTTTASAATAVRQLRRSADRVDVLARTLERRQPQCGEVQP